MTFTLRDTTVQMQQRVFEIYRLSPKMAMLEVGTGGGKTYGAIHTAASIDPNLHLLIFSTNSVTTTSQWPDQIKDYNEVMNSNLTFDMFNYEKLVATKQYPKILKVINDKKVEQKMVMIILDEVHLVKLASNAKSSKRADRLVALTRLPNVLTTLGLSATTVTNSLLDMATYLIIAGFYKNTRAFLNQHVKRYDEYHTPIIKDRNGEIREDYFNHPEQIKALYKMITVKVDTSKYKPLVHEEHYKFKLTKEQRQIYNKVIQDYDNGLYEYPVQARSAQENLLGNKIFEQKDLMLISLIERRNAGDFGEVAPILIFYEYSVVLEHLDRLLQYLYPDDPIFYLSGIRKKPKNLGKPENNRSIYLIQYMSGAEGLDWQWSNISVFYEGAGRNDKFNQAKGRNVRDKTIMAEVYHFFFEYINTVDSNRWRINSFKQDFSDKLSTELFYEELNEYRNKNG